jgi:hypothetical protein
MFLAPGKGADMVRVAERHPQLQLIVDHMGMSLSDEAIRAGNFQGAIDDTLLLARFPLPQALVSADVFEGAYPYREVFLCQSSSR